ncbi:hypothetical protein [Flaviflexus massiliensis]|uniref:hypothetical protein n=1 Tax=Flaviflexus massiliensis TaxID=1522309 RepID=UPI0006D595F6|nr:hypothetical protein [Flaviflexus massiliensis]
MKTLQIAGSIDDLFSHMALLGLSSILEDAKIGPIKLWWDDDEKPNIQIPDTVDIMGISSIVRLHAESRSLDDSWIKETFTIQQDRKQSTISLLGPRTASPVTSRDWEALESKREASLDKIPNHIDLRLIQGLGYRSWWHRVGNTTRADAGSNIWEMRTRNRGTEFLPDRLLPVAKVIADRTDEEIASGLQGLTTVDEHGGNAVDSRTPTGFSLPRPVDNALAWCALWGLSFAPVPFKWDPSRSYPAYLPKDSVKAGKEQHQLLMPVVNTPVFPARMRTLLRSQQLIAVADDRPKTAPVDQQVAWQWLQDHGVAAVIRFPVRYVGSTSAPERQALSGQRVRP